MPQVAITGLLLLSCAGSIGHPLGKAAHERGMSAPFLSPYSMYGEQETGSSNSEAEPTKQTES